MFILIMDVCLMDEPLKKYFHHKMKSVNLTGNEGGISPTRKGSGSWDCLD